MILVLHPEVVEDLIVFCCFNPCALVLQSRSTPDAKDFPCLCVEINGATFFIVRAETLYSGDGTSRGAWVVRKPLPWDTPLHEHDISGWGRKWD